jgi:hypothetical protein
MKRSGGLRKSVNARLPMACVRCPLRADSVEKSADAADQIFSALWKRFSNHDVGVSLPSDNVVWVALNGSTRPIKVERSFRSDLAEFFPLLYLGLFQQYRPEAVMTNFTINRLMEGLDSANTFATAPAIWFLPRRDAQSER